jgi:hypothetical protein
MSQKKEVIRGRSYGNCSTRCGILLFSYGSQQNYINSTTFKCIVCDEEFRKQPKSSQKLCSLKCSGTMSSKRMEIDNPMYKEEIRLKMAETLNRINHKPSVRGGNGRGPTVPQLSLYNELIKVEDSFVMECIEKTGELRSKYKSPTHYKIDIASREFKIAIEVDGSNHSSKKVKECDKRKTMLLEEKEWKVLRFTNSQIKKELMSCVQMVLSMI